MITFQEITATICDHQENATVISPKELMYLLDATCIVRADEAIESINQEGFLDSVLPTKTDEIVGYVRDRERQMFRAEWSAGWDVSGAPLTGRYDEERILREVCQIIDRQIQMTRHDWGASKASCNFTPSYERLQSFRQANEFIPSNMIEACEPQVA